MNKQEILLQLDHIKLECDHVASFGVGLMPLLKDQVEKAIDMVKNESCVPDKPTPPLPPPPILQLQEGIDMVRHPVFVNNQIKEDCEYLRSKYGSEKSLKIPTTIIRVVEFAEKCLEVGK